MLEPLIFSISPGKAADDPKGRKPLRARDDQRPAGISHLSLDRACEGKAIPQWVMDFEMEPVVSPRCNRLIPWEYDRALYQRRNEVERLFRRPKGFYQIFTRFEKLE